MVNCHSCLRPIGDVKPENPQMCKECWDKMSPGERAHYMLTKGLVRAIDSLSGRLGEVTDQARREFGTDGTDDAWRGR